MMESMDKKATLYDWNEIDRITDGKAQWAATDCHIIFAFDEKPEFDTMMGWTFSSSSNMWEIGRTEAKSKWQYTLEERPKNQKYIMSDIPYFLIPVTPMGAPRQTQRDKWAKRPVVERYHAFRDVVRLTCNLNKYSLGGEVHIEFYLPMPKGKKAGALDSLPHKEKPDLDNLLKAFMDCWEQDKEVNVIHAKKLWTNEKTGFIKVYTNQ